MRQAPAQVPEASSPVADWLRAIVIPSNVEEFWAMVAALAAIAVLGVAVWGLKSLDWAKKDILTRSEREAKLLAATRMEEFSQKIIPKFRKVLLDSRRAGMEVFVQDASAVNFGEVNEEELKRARGWISNLPKELLDESLLALNDMEAWAGYFMNGLADEEVAYGPLAPPYCTLIVQNYPILYALRAQKDAGNYPNVVGLFNAWRARLDREKNGASLAELLNRVEELQEGMVVRHTVPRPIGTTLES